MIMKLRLALRYFSSKPFDGSTPEGRARERERRVALAALSNVALRVLSGVLTLLTVPLTIGYLGPERYGLWTTITSMLAMMAFFDFGIGHGLMTEVAAATGRGESKLARLISSGFFIEVVLAAAIFCLVLYCSLFADWGHWLGLTSAQARSEAPGVVLVVGGGFCVSLVLSAVVRVQSGLQAVYVTQMWTAGGVLLTLLVLIVASSLKLGLVPLVAVMVLAPLLATAGNFSWFFFGQRPDLCPKPSHFDARLARGLLGSGTAFMAISLSAALGQLSDNFVIARLDGAAAVPALAVPARLYQLLLLPATMLVAPLWPAYGEAHARGDGAWVARTLWRSTLASLGIAALGSVVFWFVGGWFVRVWTHGTVEAPRHVLLPLGLSACLTAVGASLGTFLNGIGKNAIHAVSAVAMAVVSFGLKWLLFPQLGPAGVAWATVIGYGVCLVGPLSWLAWRETRTMVTLPS
jgi:O-antigen/teichoic acid export membrane protein